MPEFNWVLGPPYGVCFGCGTSSNDRGFVQTFTDVDVKQDGQIVGVSDVHFCGNCILSMGKLFGMATPQETEDFARRELALMEQEEKLRDEIQAWQQRFDGLLSDSFSENVRVVINQEKDKDAPEPDPK